MFAFSFPNHRIATKLPSLILAGIIVTTVACSGNAFRGATSRSGITNVPQNNPQSAPTPTPTPILADQDVIPDPTTSTSLLGLVCSDESGAPRVVDSAVIAVGVASDCPLDITTQTGNKPQYTAIDLVAVLDRADFGKHADKVHASIATLREHLGTLQTKLTDLGMMSRVGVVDFRYAPLTEWEQNLQESAADVAAAMLNPTQSPLDALIGIDPFADWLDSPNHWMNYECIDTSACPRHAGQWALQKAVNTLEESQVNAETGKILLFVSNSVHYPGEIAGWEGQESTDTAQLSTTLSAKIAAGMNIHLFHSTPADGDVASPTPAGQMNTLIESTPGLKGAHLEFPLTETAIIEGILAQLQKPGEPVVTSLACPVQSVVAEFLDGTEKTILTTENASALHERVGDSEPTVTTLTTQDLATTKALRITRCCILPDSATAPTCQQEPETLVELSTTTPSL